MVHLRTNFQNGLPRFLLWLWSALTLAAGILAAFIDLFQRETPRRAGGAPPPTRGADPGKL